MIAKHLIRPLTVFFALAGASAIFAASAKKATKSTPLPPQKPAVRIDASPVSDGRQGGVVVSYADVLEPAQKAVVSVYSTKIIKERITINPFFRQFFGDLPDQERESRQEGLGSGVIVTVAIPLVASPSPTW